MKNLAICIRCGSHKKAPFIKCGTCGHDGGNSYAEKAKSYMLSKEYLQNKARISEPSELLNEYSEKIRSGQRITFDRKIVEQLTREQKLLEDIPSRQTLRIFLFCLAFFAIPIAAVILWLLT